MDSAAVSQNVAHLLANAKTQEQAARFQALSRLAEIKVEKAQAGAKWKEEEDTLKELLRQRAKFTRKPKEKSVGIEDSVSS